MNLLNLNLIRHTKRNRKRLFQEKLNTANFDLYRTKYMDLNYEREAYDEYVLVLTVL